MSGRRDGARESGGARRELGARYRAKLFETIDAAPFIRHMGMRITDIGWGTASFALEPAGYRLQPFAVVHGGNIATLIDSATFWACFVAMGSDDDGLTSVDLKLNYLAPARTEPLSCSARMLKAGKTLFYAEAEVRGGDGRLIAHGTSTLMRLPGPGMKLGIPMWDDGPPPAG